MRRSIPVSESPRINASGVSIKYKLLSLEYLSNTKERFFKSGLRDRLTMLCNILEVKGSPAVNPYTIQIDFHRTLPANELETVQEVSTGLGAGAMSLETAVKTMNLVKDIPAEVDAIRADAAAKQAGNAAMFGVPGMTDTVV